MKYVIALFLFFLMFSCGSKKGIPDRDTGLDTSALEPLRASIENWVEPCTYGELEYPCHEGNEDHSVLWSGLMCLSGDISMCEPCLASQGPDGKVWRSPSQVGVKEGNSSSRDMFLGFMACTAATRNQDSAWRAYKYLEDNNWKLCQDADDNRCDMNPVQYRAVWGTFKRVFQHIGLRVTPTMNDAADLDEEFLYIQAQTSPEGYRTHLNAIHLHIRQYTGKWSNILQKTAIVVLEKQPNNPYYDYVANGITQKAHDSSLALCPADKPEVADTWTWEKLWSDKAWKRSMGYDCLFVFNLLKVKSTKE